MYDSTPSQNVVAIEKNNTTDSCVQSSTMKTCIMGLKFLKPCYRVLGTTFISMSFLLFSNVVHTCTMVCLPSFAFSMLNFKLTRDMDLLHCLVLLRRYRPKSNQLIKRDQTKEF